MKPELAYLGWRIWRGVLVALALELGIGALLWAVLWNAPLYR